MLKKLIKKPYYYVPPCPSCNSRKTGYYVKETSLDPSFALRESLKNGELTFAVREIPYDNAFCLDCGFSWHQNIRMKFLSIEEIEEQKIIRETANFYNAAELKNKSFLGKFM